MDVIAETKKLGFPLNQYAVFGGAVLAAHGLRSTQDLDIVVSADLFKKCIENGWEVKSWNKPGKEGKDWLKQGNTELYSEIMMIGNNLKINDLTEDIEIIDDVPFLSLQKQLALKKEYLNLYNRPKDMQDIELINQYLSK